MTSYFTLGEGYLFADRYLVGRLLGKGGMGTVYEAVHVPTARRRALKIMSYQIGGSLAHRQRFTREAQLGARIASPYLVEVLDAGVDEITGSPYIAMERLSGEDLASLLGRGGPLPPADAIRYLHQAALALQACHAASVVHRDVKPSNLFLSELPDGERRIKLLDLGIAKVLVNEEAITTESIGTPAYMAPEQLVPGGVVTPAADAYALAMVGYALLVGRGYFQHDEGLGSVFALADLIRGCDREPASARAQRAGVTLPTEFDAVFARATAVAPGKRFSSVLEMVEALASALGLALPAEQPTRELSARDGASLLGTTERREATTLVPAVPGHATAVTPEVLPSTAFDGPRAETGAPGAGSRRGAAIARWSVAALAALVVALSVTRFASWRAHPRSASQVAPSSAGTRTPPAQPPAAAPGDDKAGMLEPASAIGPAALLGAPKAREPAVAPVPRARGSLRRGRARHAAGVSSSSGPSPTPPLYSRD